MRIIIAEMSLMPCYTYWLNEHNHLVLKYSRKYTLLPLAQKSEHWHLTLHIMTLFCLKKCPYCLMPFIWNIAKMPEIHTCWNIAKKPILLKCLLKFPFLNIAEMSIGTVQNTLNTSKLKYYQDILPQSWNIAKNSNFLKNWANLKLQTLTTNPPKILTVAGQAGKGAWARASPSALQPSSGWPIGCAEKKKIIIFNCGQVE